MSEISEFEERAESWIKKELKENWFKIIAFIAVCIFVYAIVGDIKNWLNKSSTPQIVQVSPSPINLNANGQQLANPAPIYVNVNPTVTEGATATVIPQTSNATPSVVVDDPAPKFVLRYNGRGFNYVPYMQEQYNFDPRTWQFNYSRTSEINVNVEVPQPEWEIGIAKSFKSDYAIEAGLRLGRTPFNVWGYASKADQALGIKFVQYGTTVSKKDKEATSTADVVKKAESKALETIIKEGVSK